MTRVARTGLIALLLLVSVRSLAAADTLADVRGRGRLVWGGDQEGGGPYVYPSDDDPSRVVGFEVDLADRLAGFLGVAPHFFQGQWDKMPELLRTRKFDIVLNGYEWSADRARHHGCHGSLLRLRAPAHGARRRRLARRRGRPRRARGPTAASGGSACSRARRPRAYARKALRRRGRGRRATTATPTRLREVETGKLDATLQDTPIAIVLRPALSRAARARRAGRPRLLRDLRAEGRDGAPGTR